MVNETKYEEHNILAIQEYHSSLGQLLLKSGDCIQDTPLSVLRPVVLILVTKQQEREFPKI